MGLFYLHHQFQLVGVPHLDAAVVAQAVQEVLVPQDGGDAVLVGLLSCTCLRQLTLLADVPRPVTDVNLFLHCVLPA